MKHLLDAVSVVALVALSSCAAREHITESHGRAYHAAFSRQPVKPPQEGKYAEPTRGLDSEEAATIAGTYKAGLAGKNAQTTQPPQQQPVILIAPPSSSSGSPAYALPPPSVPKE